MRRRWYIALVLASFCLVATPTAAADAGLLYRQDVGNYGRLGLPPGTPVPGVPYIQRVSPDEINHLTWSELLTIQPEVRYRSLFTPNDPQLGLQWNLDAIRVPAAWDTDQMAPTYGGDPHIVVAVLDTGLAYEAYQGSLALPDLPAHVWTNPDELAGDGIDNDGNGYIDDVHGWNFVAANPYPIDNNGHGTHVAGIIAAGTNNALATAGIAFETTIMPLKVLDGSGLGTTSSLTAAVNYARRLGANIINLSLGGDQDDPIFHQAIQQAVAQGIVVIGAAGNEGVGTVTYPARYPEVISSGAVQGDLTRASYSNYGSTLDLVAPGGNIDPNTLYNNKPDGIIGQSCTNGACNTFNVMIYSGTSQAAAHVSAVAALLEACGAAPGNIRSLLTSTAQDLGPAGRDDAYGAGLIDAAAAMASVGCAATLPAAPGTIKAVSRTGSLSPLVSERAYPYVRPVFTWTGTDGSAYDVRWGKLGSQTTKRQTSTSFAPTIGSEGAYVLSVSAVDALGQSSPSVTFTYRYRRPIVLLTNGTRVQFLGTNLKTVKTITPRVTATVLATSGGTVRTDQKQTIFASVQPSGSNVSWLDTAGRVIRTLKPFGPSFRGALRVTTLQHRNGEARVVVATGTNGGSVAWYDGSGKFLGRNSLYGRYTAGLEVTSGDLDGDGTDELVVGQVAGAEIRVYDFERRRLRVIRPRGVTFRQGWSVAAGDTNGNGRAEIFATPHVTANGAKVLTLDGEGRELRSWKLGGLPSNVQVVITTADLDGDGVVELLATPRRGTAVLQRWSPKGKLLQTVTHSSRTNNSLSRM